MIPQKHYLKSKEVAKIFDVTHSTVCLWVKKGHLKPHKTLGGNFRFLRADIEKVILKKEQTDSMDSWRERRRESRYVFLTPVLIKVGNSTFSFTYNGFIRDISDRGLNLIVFDNNGLAEKLKNGDISELTVLNLPDRLFKEIVIGKIKHVEKISDRQVAVGISLD